MPSTNSYGPGDAIWTIFAAEDRNSKSPYSVWAYQSGCRNMSDLCFLAELQAILAKKQKDLFFVSEAAFLTEADLEETELPYAQFVQKQVHLTFNGFDCTHSSVKTRV